MLQKQHYAAKVASNESGVKALSRSFHNVSDTIRDRRCRPVIGTRRTEVRYRLKSVLQWLLQMSKLQSRL